MVNLQNADGDDHGSCDGQQTEYDKKDTYTNSTHTVSLRFETENIEKFQHEVHNQGMSLDSLINHIVREYFEWHIFDPVLNQ